VCTKDVTVTPGSTFQLWTALHYNCDALHVELGYNFWMRSAEKIRLKHCSVHLPCSDTAVGILDMGRICTPPATTASTAKICQSIVGPCPVVSDQIFTPIVAADFNKNSAENPAMLSHTLYASVAYTLPCASASVALNGSYEFTHSVGAVKQYALWVIVQAQF
jgi:hypothetical protein